jgi:hypothetical protein
VVLSRIAVQAVDHLFGGQPLAGTHVNEQNRAEHIGKSLRIAQISGLPRGLARHHQGLIGQTQCPQAARQDIANGGTVEVSKSRRIERGRTYRAAQSELRVPGYLPSVANVVASDGDESVCNRIG